ncbi:hypothetical protein [Microbispora sp. NBC_01389]|uniref:hypothetical protein n=1 Tax=Microbispora sp. NBC_01389 TaxID=2903584 RepID=UPI003245A935
MKNPKRRQSLRANFAQRTACVICWRYDVPEWGQSVCASCRDQITSADTLISSLDEPSEATRASEEISISVLASALRLIPPDHHADGPVAVLRRIAEQPDSLAPLL